MYLEIICQGQRNGGIHVLNFNNPTQPPILIEKKNRSKRKFSILNNEVAASYDRKSENR